MYRFTLFLNYFLNRLRRFFTVLFLDFKNWFYNCWDKELRRIEYNYPYYLVAIARHLSVPFLMLIKDYLRSFTIFCTQMFWKLQFKIMHMMLWGPESQTLPLTNVMLDFENIVFFYNWISSWYIYFLTVEINNCRNIVN